MEYSPLVRSEIDLQCSYGSMYEDLENALWLIQSGQVDKAVFDVSKLRD
jgi:L-iditol 2-dehydrogenase